MSHVISQPLTSFYLPAANLALVPCVRVLWFAAGTVRMRRGVVSAERRLVAECHGADQTLDTTFWWQHLKAHTRVIQ